MCGDVDEETGELEDALYARFLGHARALLEGRAETAPASDDPYAYMDQLFADALGRCVRDGNAAGENQSYARLSLQPLVFARLAGFLAGHLALDQEPLRKVIEALMHGYSEAAPQADHDHEHADDHDHEHDHHH
jgi:hypothetical protein